MSMLKFAQLVLNYKICDIVDVTNRSSFSRAKDQAMHPRTLALVILNLSLLQGQRARSSLFRYVV